ncbi:MAG: ATP phosphoribosyltransferase regulatory subunit, partial [Gemmatimonadetes bacterium]|nr:ATP phosphoribosyltransferase regulatory subunit [Gemmatimonadota bacterium]
ALMRAAGVAEDRLLAAYSVVDKIEREGRDKSRERLQAEAGLDAAAADAIVGLFDAPGLDAVRERFGDREEVAEALDRFSEYLETLDALGLGAFVDFDLTIVRGLAYYTGIVFEIFDARGELRAVCGGGRYDRLLELVGGEPLPAVGFGMGDVVLTELLRDLDRLPDTSRSVDWFVVVIGDELRPRALDVARRLRARGESVAYALRRQAVRKQFKAVESEGARRVLVLAPDEAARGEAVVRDMESGHEETVSLATFVEG